MTKNAIIFVLASLSVLVGWQFLTEKLNPAKPGLGVSTAAGSLSATAQTNVAAATVVEAPLKANKVPGVLKSAPEKTVRVETAAYDVTLSSWGARFISLKLKGVSQKGNAAALDLVPTVDNPLYGAIEMPGADLARQTWTLLTPNAVDEGGMKVVRFGIRVAGTTLDLTKTFSFDPSARKFFIGLTVKNNGSQALNLNPVALLWGPNIGGDVAGIGAFPPAGVVQLEGKIEREKASSDTQVLGYAAPKWVALKDHYFVLGYFPLGSAWNKAEIRRLGGDKVVTALLAEGLSLVPGQSVELKAEAYAGPQDYDALKAVGNNFQRVVQFQFYQIFDWLNPLCVGLLHVLKWFYKVTGNWGVAIILLTLVVRGAMFWPSLKSMVSMRRMQTKMAAMAPRLETLKKVYKDDPTRMNQETMKLYKEFGVNPLGGCLPMLLQIPIFFALYGTLSAAFELRGAPFFWKWTDLTAGDPTYMFPIAMGITMFLQQKLAPTSATMSDEQAQMQKMMLWMMPIMFTGMALFMHWPMGLLLYWTASNIFGIVQQVAVNKSID